MIAAGTATTGPVAAGLVVVAVLVWAAFLLRARSLLGDRSNLALWSFCIALLGISLAVTIMIPQVYLWLDRLIGVPNAGRLLIHGFGLLCGLGLQLFLLFTSHRRDRASGLARWRVAVFVVTVAALGVLFGAAPVDVDTTEFTERYATARWVPQYMLVFLAYLGWALGDYARMAWRYSFLTAKRYLPLGLRLQTAGCLVGLLYIGYKSVFVVCRLIGGRLAGSESVLSSMLIGVAVLLVVAGSTVPEWGPWPAAARGWLRMRSAYGRLLPLWAEVQAVTPGITLVERGRIVDRLDPRDLRFRVHRRVVEIRDGQRELRDHVDDSVGDRVRGLAAEAGVDPLDVPVLVEAAELAVALRARAAGRPPPRTRHEPVSVAGGADLEGEAARLARVACAVRRSPIVAAAVAAAEAAAT